ncbi:MAG TPA: MFS transporter [Pirellulaceae bacterium]|nr:MFS transporter [Pirellulaceae bacterium]
MKPASTLLTLLLVAAALHCLVDTVAGTLNPLWPRFETHFQLDGWETAALFFVWQLTTSVSQFFFGLYGDRFHSRWLLWAGPLVAILCLGSVGLTTSPVVFGLLLVAGGLGIAAFHPEAAALVGSSAPEHRSRAMSVFTMGGFMGQALGPAYSGAMVDSFDLRGLAWGIAGGLMGLVFLAPLVGGAAPARAPTTRPPADLRHLFRGRAGAMLLVLIVGALRIIAAGGVPVLIGFLLASRGAGTTQTGLVQSAFMLGIGLGGLACATLVRPQHERPILWLCPLAVTPVLILIPWLSGAVLAATICLAGVLLGISLPVLISYGQQLLPGSQRIASSITMGVSWGLGGGIVAIILAVCQSSGRFDLAFHLFAGATALSSLLCIWLPAVAPARAVAIAGTVTA